MSKEVIALEQTRSLAAQPKRFQLRFAMRLVQGMLLLLLISQAVGCACYRQKATQFVDNALVLTKERIWARRAYNLRFGSCERNFGDHFRNGFIDGYCNVCSGGDGFVPATPPDCYWGYQYQSADGSKCVNAWFEGYPAGALAAKQDDAGSYHDVYISHMINSAVVQDNATKVLPSDVPVVSQQNNGSRVPTPAPRRANLSSTLYPTSPLASSDSISVDPTIKTTQLSDEETQMLEQAIGQASWESPDR